MTDFDPSENEIFLASDGFTSELGPFAGVDAFAPGGPMPRFARDGEALPTQHAPERVPVLDCADVQHHMEVFLDGELVAPQQQQISNHLSRCIGCQGAQLFQTQLRTMVAQKALQPMPDDVRARITRALGL